MRWQIEQIMDWQCLYGLEIHREGLELLKDWKQGWYGSILGCIEIYEFLLVALRTVVLVEKEVAGA